MYSIVDNKNSNDNCTDGVCVDIGRQGGSRVDG
jgi:hypothetical protein